MIRSVDKIVAVVLFLVALPAFAQNAPPPPPDAAPQVAPSLPALQPAAPPSAPPTPPPSPYQMTLPPPPPPHSVPTPPPFYSTGPMTYDQAPFLVPCESFGLLNTPGFFASAEADLMFTEFTRFTGTPAASLDAAVMPVVELGYRFGWGGAVLFRYRYLNTSGSSSYDDPFLGPSNVQTRLVDNIWDIDYQSRVYGGAGGWALQWAVGARIADFEARSDYGNDTFGDIFSRNAFTGAGPHASLTAWRGFGDSGWSTFASVDGSVIFGQGRQDLNFNNAQDLVFPGSPTNFTANGSETVPGVNLRVGLSWSRMVGPALLRVDGGYVYEEWWLSATGKNSDNAIYERIGWRSQGPFLRLEVGF